MVVIIDGHLVKKLRVKHSFSQERLAEIIGVNARTIQRIESNGLTSLATRGALAKALGVRPEDLDVPEAPAVVSAQGEPLASWPRWSFIALSTVLVVLGWIMLAVSIESATPILPAIGGVLISLIGFVVLTRVTPLRRWRTYAVLSIVVVAMAGSPPAWTIRALVVISLWATLELGVLLTRFRFSARHS